MTLEDAFKIISFNCIAQVELNAAILTKTYDAEALHQMRVGFRRFNSLLKICDDILQFPETLKLELEWVSQLLGETRDWDTLINSTLPMVNKKLPGLAAYPKVNLIAHRETEKKHRQLTAIIKSQRYTKFIQNLKKYLLVSGWRESMPSIDSSRLSEELNHAASFRLARQRKFLISRGKNIHAAKRKKIHRFRIAAKRLRYASEFLQSLYPTKKVCAYIKKLAKLQDVLGLLNDAVVANRLLKEITSEDATFQKELALIRLTLKSEAAVKHKKIDALWNDFTSSTPFWKDMD